MGYFSELDLYNKECAENKGYRSYIDQLLWRYEGLKERYSLLYSSGASCFTDDRFSTSELKYSPVDSFKSLHSLRLAIQLAEQTLEGYGASLDELEEPSSELSEKQISIFEIVFIPPRHSVPLSA